MVGIALDEMILAGDNLKLGLQQLLLNPLSGNLVVARFRSALRCLWFAVNHDESSTINQRLRQMVQNGPARC